MTLYIKITCALSVILIGFALTITIKYWQQFKESPDLIIFTIIIGIFNIVLGSLILKKKEQL